jgi:TrmH family RNA methyltransferase
VYQSAHYNECLLNEAHRDQLEVVLVSPRNPLNIGAAARAMANFGFVRLTVVSPYEAHWREARSAVGAADLLKQARETVTLSEALGNANFVVGTGMVTIRKPEQPVVALPGLAPLVERELRRGGRVALVFGAEKHGLTREDLSRCHLLVEIPTDARQPSMNLGQAVGVCLFELATRMFLHSGEAAVQVPAGEPGAEGADLDRLAQVITETMAAAHYSPHDMQEANRHDVRLLLRRLDLNAADARRVLGLFRKILWRLKH